MERKYIYLLLIGAIVILITTMEILPPHSSPGITDLGGREAIVHPGEDIVIYTSQGKASKNITFSYDGERISASGFLYSDEKRLPKSEEVTFTVGLLHYIKARRDGENAVFSWPWPDHMKH